VTDAETRVATRVDDRDTGRQQHRAVRLRHLLVVLLAVNSGATDAIGFVGLGGVFTSVMTGNMVLLGLSASRLDGTLALHTSAAIAFFALGCGIGARVAHLPRRGDPVWPAAVTRALVVELVAFLVFLCGWELTGGRPGEGLQLLLLVVNALGLGIQSSAIQRFGVSGLSTTYLTGTLTTVVIRLVTGQGLRDVRNSVEILLALVAGAAAGGALALHLPRVAPLLQVCLVAVVLTTAAWRFGRRPPR
jgi:uncharacterized membrane protein YoaK (UPF0700 family)